MFIIQEKVFNKWYTLVERDQPIIFFEGESIPEHLTQDIRCVPVEFADCEDDLR